MTTLRFIDECTAKPEVKPEEMTITYEPGVLMLRQDSLYVDGIAVAYRIEPRGYGDVHWEVGTDKSRRFTRIEVLP